MSTPKTTGRITKRTALKRKSQTEKSNKAPKSTKKAKDKKIKE